MEENIENDDFIGTTYRIGTISNDIAKHSENKDDLSPHLCVSLTSNQTGVKPSQLRMSYNMCVYDSPKIQLPTSTKAEDIKSYFRRCDAVFNAAGTFFFTHRLLMNQFRMLLIKNENFFEDYVFDISVDDMVIDCLNLGNVFSLIDSSAMVFARATNSKEDLAKIANGINENIQRFCDEFESRLTDSETYDDKIILSPDFTYKDIDKVNNYIDSVLIPQYVRSHIIKREEK